MISIALALLIGGAPGGQSVSGTVSRGNFLPISQYRTPGDTSVINYYVDPTGSDGNPCTTAGTGACLTIQAALNKVPKLLRQQVTINIAAGTYAGANVSGFTSDIGVQQTTGGLYILGALATSTLTTGSATGTATGGTAGSGSTFGTLVDSGASWTVNDLRGRFITTASPTNTGRVISSNTGTTITIDGTWTVPVNGSTTYTIQDPSVIINAAATRPATPFSAGFARAGLIFASNSVGYTTNALVVQNIRVANATGGIGIDINDSSAYRFVNLQVRPASANGTGINLNGGAGRGVATVSNCDVLLGTTPNAAVAVSAPAAINISGSLLRTATATNPAVSIGNSFGTFGEFTFTQSEVLNFLDGIAVISGFGQGGNISNSNITCVSSSGVGIRLGSTTTNIAGVPSVASPITAFNIGTCGTAVQVVGPAAADVTSMTGSTNTTGFAVYNGGLITFAKSGVTLTAGTNEINLDSGGVTGAFADVTAGTCLMGAGTASRVCGR